MKIIDLSHEISSKTSSYPGDPKVIIKQEKSFDKDKYNLGSIYTNMHVATHIDAPMHMSSNKDTIGKYDIDNFIKEAVLIKNNSKVIDWTKEYDSLNLNNKILIINTGHYKKYNSENYYVNHPVITLKFVQKAVSKGVKAIGIDTPSPDTYPYLIHQYLFSNNIFIIENLNHLDLLNEYNEITFYAVPLKIDFEASLVRAFAILK